MVIDTSREVINMSQNEQTPGPEQAKRELSAYEKLMRQTRQHMDKLTSAVDADGLRKIIDKAAIEMKDIGEHSRDAVTKASEAFKKDLATTAEHVKPAMETLGRNTTQALSSIHHTGGQVWTHLAKGTGGAVEAWRDWSANLTSDFFKGVSAWSAKLGQHLDDSLVYHTGDMTYGGKFKCQSCGAELMIDKPGHLPACGDCAKTEFRRA